MNRDLPKEDTQMETSIWKDDPHHIPLVNWKLKKKKKADITTCLLEWPASKGLTTPNAGMDVNQQEFSFLGGGDAKW